jgi:hypothetical protein
MHPDHREGLLKLLADTDQCRADLANLPPEEQEYAELAAVLSRELKRMSDWIEDRVSETH